MRELLILSLAVLVTAGSVVFLTSNQNRDLQTQPDVPNVNQLMTFENAPEDFIAPPLHPGDIQLQTQQLAPDVYAIVSGHPAVDNSGFIVGERSVLVIDSHINAQMAKQIQNLVRQVTDKPILYLVNTNYHGDHTFGNDSFPAETTIIAHRNTYARMVHFDHEKQSMMATVGFDESVFGDVQLRLPDVTFDEFLSIDLGGRTVEVYHFGHGNTPGDAVVYDPQARVAWTGNFVVGEGFIPPMFEGRAAAYLDSVRRFNDTLPVRTIVPGHGFLTDSSTLDRYEVYLEALIEDVRQAVRQGWSLEKTLERIPLKPEFQLEADSELAQLAPFLDGLHRLNVQLTYLELKR